MRAKGILIALLIELMVLSAGCEIIRFASARPAAEEAVVLGVSPRVCHAPCVVAVTLRIPAAARGDAARVEIDGREYHSTAVNVVEGRSTYVLPPWLVQAPGEYTVTAVLLRGSDTFTARSTVQVGGVGE